MSTVLFNYFRCDIKISKTNEVIIIHTILETGRLEITQSLKEDKKTHLEGNKLVISLIGETRLCASRAWDSCYDSLYSIIPILQLKVYGKSGHCKLWYKITTQLLRSRGSLCILIAGIVSVWESNENAYVQLFNINVFLCIIHYVTHDSNKWFYKQCIN